MKNLFCFFVLIPFFLISQNEFSVLKGSVENEITELPMQSVHVINLTRVIGTITDDKGQFEIEVSVNDTLYFSYVGYKPIKVFVTSDMIKFKNSKID